jgi:lysozyme
MPASSEQITAAFSTVSTAPLGLAASHYRAWSDLNLPETTIDNLLDKDISSFTAELRKHLPKFDSYPDPAQDALFDMAYNLGIGGLLKFHNLLAACDVGDWDRAAQESARNGIGAERNQGTAELFRQAKQT